MSEDVMGKAALHISLTIPPAEMASWTPERIKAFFEGLSQALTARRGESRVRVVMPLDQTPEPNTGTGQ